MSDVVKKVLQERGDRYGTFEKNALIAQGIKDVMAQGNNWGSNDFNYLSPVMCETLDMIASKIARIVNGDPFYEDNWIDIIGYTQLALDEIKKENAAYEAELAKEVENERSRLYAEQAAKEMMSSFEDAEFD